MSRAVLKNGVIDFEIDTEALRKAEDLLIRGYLWAAKQTINEASREFEKRLEARTRDYTKGNLHSAWASDVRPKAKNKIAREPVGFIYVNGGERTRKALDYQTTSGRVASLDGGYLAIPLPAAGSRGRLRDITPGEWERQHGIRLQYVYRGFNRPALLVAKGTLNMRSATFRPITRRRTATDEKRGYQRGESSVPIFALIAPRNFRSKFTIEDVMAPAGEWMRDHFEREVRKIQNVRREVGDVIG